MPTRSRPSAGWPRNWPGSVASPRSAPTGTPPTLEALHLPEAWETSTGEGVLVAVVERTDDTAARTVEAAAPDAEVESIPVVDDNGVATAVADAAERQVGVITLIGVPEALGDD